MAIQNISTLKDKIIEKYSPLVNYIASRVIIGKSRYIEYDDLISCGMLGLIDAVNKFDNSKGIKFSTYASIRIKGSMIDEIRRNSPFSKSIIDKIHLYNNAIEVLQNKLLREPSSFEIADFLKISLKDISIIQKYISSMSPVFFEELVLNDESGLTLSNIIEDKNTITPEENIEKKELIEQIANAIDKLKEKDKLVLSLYYKEELTLKQIGVILEVSESRVCQIHSRAISNLKKLLKI